MFDIELGEVVQRIVYNDKQLSCHNKIVIRFQKHYPNKIKLKNWVFKQSFPTFRVCTEQDLQLIEI